MTLFQPQPTDAVPAFPVLFESYKNLVFKTALLMLGSAEEAEDALQEVFVLVYRSLGRYDPARGALTTWLHRITVNYCLGVLRKKRVAFIDDGEGEVLENVPAAAEPDREEREAMLQAIRRLDARLQAVVVLRYYWDLPYAEIAEVLDIPLGTVKSRLDHATRRLRVLYLTEKAPAADAAAEIVVKREARSCPS